MKAHWSKSSIQPCWVALISLHQYTNKKMKKIGLQFGIGESGVSQTCRRVAQKIEKDKKMKKRLIDWKSKYICQE